MLEKDSLDPGLGVLTQPRDHTINRPDQHVVLLEQNAGIVVPAAALETPLRTLECLALVAADAARGHQRERDRLPSLALARLRDRSTAFAALLHRRERRVVLVGPACRQACHAWPGAPAHDDR